MFLRSPALRRYVPLLLFMVLVLPITAHAQTTASKHFIMDKTCVAANDANVPAGPPASRPLGMQIAYGKGGNDHYFSLSTVCSNGAGNPINNDDCRPLGLGGACSGGGICTGQLKEPACFTGEQVAALAGRAICYQASSRGATYTINGSGSFNCATLEPFLAFTLTIIDTTMNPSCGFTVTKVGGDVGLSFGVAGPSSCQYDGVLTSNNGTTQQVDMLNHYFVQVDPAGVSSGSFSFKLWAKGNTNPASPNCTFSVPYNANSDTLHQAIADGFNNCSTLALVANKKTLKIDSEFAGTSGGIGANPFLPEIYDPSLTHLKYSSGPYVAIENASSKLENVEVSTSNQATFVIAETSNKALNANVPALNPWAVALLVAMLMLSSFWFFRKRTSSSKA